MSDQLFVGVDLGTQSVKVCVVDGSGAVHAETSRPLISRRDGHLHEQSPRQWIDATAEAMTEAIGRLDDPSRRCIASIATCGTSGTVTTVDRDGAPVSTGVMYDDTSAGALVDEIAEADPERWSRLGYRIQPSWAITSIVQSSRRGLPQDARFAHQPDVVNAAMTSHGVATDWSSALKSAFDLLELAWPVRTLGHLGVDENRLPDVVAPGTVLGHTDAAWRDRTGVPTGTAVVAGTTDGCASQLGAGALAEGDWHSVIGTTLVLKGVTDTLLHDEAGAIYSHRSPVDGQWLPGGASSIGARAVSSLFPGADLDQLERAAARRWMADRATVPVCYPLVGAGERFPFVRPDASGFVLRDGRELDLAALGDGPEAYLSILIGVACVERLCFDVLAARGAAIDGRLTTSGGATRSSLWNQLRADMLRRPLHLPDSAQPSTGMAILGAATATGESLVATARAMTRIGRTIEPDAAGTDALERHYEIFRLHLIAKGWA